MKKDNKKKETTRKDMFHFLCRTTDSVMGEHYSEDALQGEAIMLIVAGPDSISTVRAGMWFYLPRNELVYKRSIDELRSTFNHFEEIVSGPKLASCVYLHACIDKALRISPAGPSEFAWEVLTGGGVIHGEFFPVGVVVGCAHWAMGHNGQVFWDPGRFRQKRYIPSEITGVTAEDVRTIRSYYHTFLIGPFNFVGKNIAMTEMALVVARTLFRVDLSAVSRENSGAVHASLGWEKRDEGQHQISNAYVEVLSKLVYSYI
jgi:cytochrome P450